MAEASQGGEDPQAPGEAKVSPSHSKSRGRRRNFDTTLPVGGAWSQLPASVIEADVPTEAQLKTIADRQTRWGEDATPPEKVIARRLSQLARLLGSRDETRGASNPLTLPSPAFFAECVRTYTAEDAQAALRRQRISDIMVLEALSEDAEAHEWCIWPHEGRWPVARRWPARGRERKPFEWCGRGRPADAIIRKVTPVATYRWQFGRYGYDGRTETRWRSTSLPAAGRITSDGNIDWWLKAQRLAAPQEERNEAAVWDGDACPFVVHRRVFSRTNANLTTERALLDVIGRGSNDGGGGVGSTCSLRRGASADAPHLVQVALACASASIRTWRLQQMREQSTAGLLPEWRQDPRSDVAVSMIAGHNQASSTSMQLAATTPALGAVQASSCAMPLTTAGELGSFYSSQAAQPVVTLSRLWDRRLQQRPDAHHHWGASAFRRVFDNVRYTPEPYLIKQGRDVIVMRGKNRQFAV